MPLANHATSVPVVVDEEKCIADKGCRPASKSVRSTCWRSTKAAARAYMKYDECWYCMPCEVDCPTGAVKVNIPYLLR